MLQSTFLARQAKSFNRKQLYKRLLKASFYAALAFLMWLSATIFAWTAATFDAPVNDPNFPLPSWTWTTSMVVVSISSLFAAVWTTFAMLDEIFYPAGHRNRITKRHR